MTNAYLTTQTLLKIIFYIKLKQQININLELFLEMHEVFHKKKGK